MTKIAIRFVEETSVNIDDNPEEFRPIGLVRDLWELTEDYEEADWIYFYLDYLACNEQFLKVLTDEVFDKYASKSIFYAIHDTPSFAYTLTENEGIKFVAQPLMNHALNSWYGVVPVPLQMRKFELELIKDTAFIEEIRAIPKTIDFCFIGQTGYQGRERFRPENLKLPAGSSYLFEETQPIWHIKGLDERVQLTKDFCRKIAQCKFCFAPRGIGSNSFRLYQSLMSGTIPIVYGMMDAPFKEVLHWRNFSLDGDSHHVTVAGAMMGYSKLQAEYAAQVWDEYFHMVKTDEYLFDKYLEKDNETGLNSRWYVQ